MDYKECWDLQEGLMADALAAQEAGAFGIVLECIPASIGKSISERLEIPTIGIGAGPHCDGQVLVIHDLIGLTTGYVPSFVKPLADVGNQIQNAVRQWDSDVREGRFPSEEQSF